MSGPAGIIEPATLLRLIEDSGHSFPVIEEAVRLLRRGLACIDTQDPALVEILRSHLLAVGSPTDVTKYFSLELLERANPGRAEDTAVELAELLVRSPLVPERGYHVERAVLKALGEKRVARSLSALVLLAARGLAPLAHAAARAVVAILEVEPTAEAIAPRLPSVAVEGMTAEALAASVVKALDEAPRRRLPRTGAKPLEGSDRFLRPEAKRARQARLRATLRSDNRDPSRCGNCDLAVKTVIVHVVPPSRGGSDRPGNLVPLCQECRRRLPRRRGTSTPTPAATQMTLFG